MVEEGVTINRTEEIPEISIQDQLDAEYKNFLAALIEIRKNKDILGFILKNDAKATVDLDEPTKIIEYAMLSSQAFESAETLSTTFSLGDIKSILIKGKNIKALCISQRNSQLSIFMEKNANFTDIMEAFYSKPE